MINGINILTLSELCQYNTINILKYKVRVKISRAMKIILYASRLLKPQLKKCIFVFFRKRIVNSSEERHHLELRT